MKLLKSLFVVICMFVFSGMNDHIYSQTQASFITIQGYVVGQDTRAPLPNASITVQDINISTVANQDGYFALRIPASSGKSQVIVRHLGYENRLMPVASLLEKPGVKIMMNPFAIRLDPVHVVSGDGASLIKRALARIPENYPSDPNMMVAFYRESAQKGSNYISLVEAVLDVYKSPYKGFGSDQARIYIGRKATDFSPRDTVALKFQGGISSALMLDVAKNPEVVFPDDGIEYTFTISGMVNINNKPHYKILFQPIDRKEILFEGTVYIEARSLAFARMEFSMTVEDRKEASLLFIKRKPAKMKASMNHARYVVDYTEKDGKWYFNYSSTDISFKVRWTNRFFGLFATSYVISSEIAITDRYSDNITKFPRKERIHSTDVIAEKVEYFRDPNFWGDYNVIEPDKEISNAITKLSNKLLRRAN